MDGRNSLLLALSLWAGAVGCASLDKNQTQQLKERITLGTPEESAKSPGNEPKLQTPLLCVAAADYFMNEAAGKADAPAMQQHLYERARKAYQKANQMDPNFLPGYQGLANWYLTQDDYDHAIATYQKAIQVAPPNTPLLWYELGMCFCRKKDWTNGLASLGKAVELDPENRQYVDVLGYTFARMGRYDESLACFIRVHPKAKAHYNLARMLQHTKEMDMCRYHLEMALQADPQMEAAQSLLVQINGGVPAQAAAQPVQQAGYEETMITARLPAQPPLQQAPQQPVADSLPSAANAVSQGNKEEQAPAPGLFVEPEQLSDLLPPPPSLQIDPSVKKGQ